MDFFLLWKFQFLFFVLNSPLEIQIWMLNVLSLVFLFMQKKNSFCHSHFSTISMLWSKYGWLFRLKCFRTKWNFYLFNSFLVPNFKTVHIFWSEYNSSSSSNDEKKNCKRRTLKWPQNVLNELNNSCVPIKSSWLEIQLSRFDWLLVVICALLERVKNSVGSFIFYSRKVWI